MRSKELFTSMAIRLFLGILLFFGIKILRVAWLEWLPEPTVGPSRLNDLDLNGCLYHNAGVLLVDLKQWRSTCCEDQLLDYCERRSGRLFANDQDALNAVLKDKICSLSPAFNYSNIFDYYPFIFLNSLMPGFSDENSFNTARSKPIVVHYSPLKRGHGGGGILIASIMSITFIYQKRSGRTRKMKMVGALIFLLGGLLIS